MVNNNNNNMVVFLNLTCGNNSHHEDVHHHQEPNSTHDLAEMMIYAYVDDSPSVADLLWSKQQLNQGEFLKLTDEQEWSQLPTVDYSTHEPYFR
ncbi:hypothetical protein V8B55DRAFT_1479123 [Mucor lusitanicus]|uniref:Uncharacterized protein n=1 Tax=Mucor circinelloides f. lusitanicus TaxID=29924 RepID=A0A8H4BJ77_MUCCL|nr:hypothetical protein FB192DRAFT_1106425 [Mucor lusitanicus]